MRIHFDRQTAHFFNRRSGFVFTLVFAAICASVASAGTWLPHGPDGGNVIALAVHPSDPNTVYAGTEGDLYRSTDGGAHWAGLTLPGFDYDRVAVALTDPNDIYADNARSSDSGATWTTPDVVNVAVDPTDAEIRYENAAYFPGIVRVNHGVSTEINPPSSARFTVVAPSHPTTIYVATRSPTTGVYRSDDSGDTWTFAATGLTSPAVRELVVDPSDSLTVYASTESGVFKTTDGGAHWALSNNGLSDTDVNEVAVDPATPATIYAATGGGVSKSIDGGANWSDAFVAPQAVNSIAVSPSDPLVVYAGTEGRGVYKSIDGGATWNSTGPGMSAAFIAAIAMDPLDPAIGYAAGAEIWKTTDHGDTWNTVLSQRAWCLAVDPTTPSTIYAGDIGVRKSIDAGTTWNPTGPGLPAERVVEIAIAPTGTSTIYAATEGGGVFKTTNGGTSWSAVNSGITNLDVRTIAIDPYDSSHVIIGTGGDGMFATSNGGTNWTLVGADFFHLPSSDVSMYAVRFDPFLPGVIYASPESQLLTISLDGGLTWDLAYANPPPVVTPDPFRDGTLYSVSVQGQFQWSFSHLGGSFYVSSADYATHSSPSWTRSIGVSPGSPAFFVGTNAQGIWTFVPNCGDGIVDEGEQCDDGNVIETDGCLTSCQLAITAANMIPGPGPKSKTAECRMEMLIDPPAIPTAAGYPSNKVVCKVDDPSCDAQIGDSYCTFRYALCFNVIDPRLVVNGVPACTPTDLLSVTVVGKSPGLYTTMLSAVPLRQYPVKEALLPPLPMTETNKCSDHSEISVVPKSATRAGKFSLRIRTESTDGRKDTDTFKFVCEP